MKNGICPKCGSHQIMSELRVLGGQDYPPYVDVIEPKPVNNPFIWMPKFEQSQFSAYVCGGCGYTEFYANNYQAMNEGYQKGYRSK